MEKEDPESHSTLHIAAGGKNERISEYIAQKFGDVPKGLLPIPGDHRTLIEKIVDEALVHFSEVLIHTSDETFDAYFLQFQNHSGVRVLLTNAQSFLSTIACTIVEHERVFLASADYYANLGWENFVRFHDSRKLPVSCVATRSPKLAKATVVEVKDDVVTGWKMGCPTSQESYVNSGMFIFDDHPEVLKTLDDLLPERDLDVEVVLAEIGLLSCYLVKEYGWNINDPESYESMVGVLKSA